MTDVATSMQVVLRWLYGMLPHRVQAPDRFSRNADIARQHSQGVAVTELAAQFGLTVQYIRRILKSSAAES